MKRETIYTITTMTNLRPDHELRCVGWFKTVIEASLTIKGNYCDIWEGDNNYAVVEEFSFGLYPHPIREIWFKWDKDKGQYAEIEKPKEVANLINFGIG